MIDGAFAERVDEEGCGAVFGEIFAALWREFPSPPRRIEPRVGWRGVLTINSPLRPLKVYTET